MKMHGPKNKIVVSSTRRQHFTAKEIPWYSFTLEAEWTPGLMIADRRNGAPENFQGSYRESNPEPLVCGAIPQPNALIISVIRKSQIVINMGNNGQQ